MRINLNRTVTVPLPHATFGPVLGCSSSAPDSHPPSSKSDLYAGKYTMTPVGRTFPAA